MSSLRKYEDWIFLIAVILAAIADALQAHPRYAIWAVILGAAGKALFSIIDEARKKSFS